MNVGDRLETLRRAMGLTWEELGEKLGLSRTMLHYVKQGKRELGVKAMYRLKQAEVSCGIRDYEGETLTLISAGAALAKKRALEGHLGEENLIFTELMQAPAGELKLIEGIDSILVEVREMRARLLGIEERLTKLKTRT